VGREDRDALLAMGRAAGATVELHVLDVPAEELWRRLARRNAVPGETVIDRPTLVSYLDSWQPPTSDETARYDPPLT
jgi:predicted kinase